MTNENQFDPYLGHTHGKCKRCGLVIYNGIQHKKWCRVTNSSKMLSNAIYDNHLVALNDKVKEQSKCT